MSEPFGWCPNDHKQDDGGLSVAQQFSAAAVQIAQDTAQRFQQRLEAEAAMKDTQPLEKVIAILQASEALNAMKDTEMPLTHIQELAQDLTTIDGHFDRIITQRNDLHTENGLLRRSLEVLTHRIEELEAEIDEIRGTATPLLAHMERIAETLRTFYFAPLTLSAIQPILALCIELNEDIVEQRR